MEKKWTEWPWKVVEHSWSDTSVTNDNETICALCILSEATEDNQEELEAIMAANAHLIAAAPELYEVLEKVFEVMKDDMPVGLRKVAWDAMEKARGEQ